MAGVALSTNVVFLLATLAEWRRWAFGWVLAFLMETKVVAFALVWPMPPLLAAILGASGVAGVAASLARLRAVRRAL